MGRRVSGGCCPECGVVTRVVVTEYEVSVMCLWVLLS